MSLSRIGVATLILGSCCGVQPAGTAEIAASALVEGIPAHGSLSREPAKAWEQAFVTGNGRMAAMVYGEPTQETIVVNHCRLFLPLGNREIVPTLAPDVPELRRIIRDKGYGAAMNFFLGKARQQGYPGIIPTDPYHPAFKLSLEVDDSRGYEDYLRT
ncbi:MAG: glycoside hydrolase N-terminal domain-containing protein, partial [Verrucomicrobia bacterium]|nr:glycoside hydrolase N-terminal domain-containing protein [Verrucomicrobiota bacterium]